jgi:hypothetical protein
MGEGTYREIRMASNKEGRMGGKVKLLVSIEGQAD